VEADSSKPREITGGNELDTGGVDEVGGYRDNPGRGIRDERIQTKRG